MFHNDPAGTAAIGGVGGSLGAAGIADGLVLELDTYWNSGTSDIVNDHGAIWDTDDGELSGQLTTAVDLGNLENGDWHEVSVVWDAIDATLSYTVDGINAGQISGDLVQSYFGGASLVTYGFTGATGGLSNTQQIRLPGSPGNDPDGDGIASHLDLDSDNDGIPDNVEAQAPASYLAPSGIDGNADGLDDVYGSGLTPVDTDGDGIADFLDKDSDNDGISDEYESGVALAPLSERFTLLGSAELVSDRVIQLTAASSWQTGTAWSAEKIDFSTDFNLSFEAYLGDKDGDGADGIALVFHNDPAGTAAIGDVGGLLGAAGIADGLVLELDTYWNSGASDIVNDHGAIWDTDDAGLSGQLTSAVDLGNLENGGWHVVSVVWDAINATLSYTVDGINAGQVSGDLVQNYFGGANLVTYGFTGATGGLNNTQQIRLPGSPGNDPDGDGIANHLDLDSDNDGIPDNVEAQAPASYLAPSGIDGNADGLDDVYGSGLTPVDTDGDGIADFLDKDSDNDGISDEYESGVALAPLSERFTLQGSAEFVSDTVIQLTADSSWQTGTAWSAEKIDFSTDFDLSFEAYLGDKDGDGADGIALVFHNDPAGTAAIGDVGGLLGAAGIADGLVLELDTYWNSGASDIVNDHGAIWDTDDAGLSGQLTTAVDLGNLENGGWHEVGVVWDAMSATLSYTVDGINAGQVSGDLVQNYFGGASLVTYGFTGATGGLSNTQQIRLPGSPGNDPDGDGIANHLDLDSDNDGIPDNVEAQAPASYLAPSGIDGNADGLDDVYGSGLTPVDTDGDGIADFLSANFVEEPFL